ncbi:Branched-chain-amino-acid aminotransferase [Armadillidium nasatum]|uniref:branched-chain-amino-acid transaminase n=1 Tax=Armadillidium nasatum TaxID=96803 RepID=A0A5N5TFB6_9CRUS|nr:Branched-chain-amino-acid aminotransferase [Armadillidium nasatum]
MKILPDTSFFLSLLTFGVEEYFVISPSFTRLAADVEIQFCPPDKLKPKPAVKDLVFGKTFTEHMLEIQWVDGEGWHKPQISPFHNLSMHPAAKSLHYSVQFEGMKAYRGVDGKIRLFRPDENMKRMNRTAERASLPTFDGEELIELIKKLIRIDQEWVPHSESSSLYVRPTLISNEDALKVEQPSKALLFVILSPTGPYFSTGFNAVSLLADPQYVRSWPGGCGHTKMGANYGPTLMIQKEAMKKGLQQVLWLYGPDHRLTEVGAMNIMIVLKKKNGGIELVTPPLDGLILPGVTRLSILEIVRSWPEYEVTERDITMAEVVEASKEDRLLEIFGAGTAVVVCPVGEIHYMDKVIKVPTMQQEKPLYKKVYNAILDIQYGRNQHPWAVPID